MSKRDKSKKTLKLNLVLVVMLLAATGLILLRNSGAAGFSASAETEVGTLAGSAVKVAASGASGGEAVRFQGGGTTPNPPPGGVPPITRDGIKLMRNGQQWKFAGMNADGWGLNSCRAAPEYVEPSYMTDANLDQYFRELNPRSVTRIWPYKGADNIPMMDRIVSAAEKHGQYLAPAFFDGNDGGAQCGSMRWGNAPANLAHIEPIIKRYAKDTGARKTNVIAFWEVSNEIGIVSNTSWYNEIARGMKQWDPKTLVGTGASPYKGGSNTGASLTTAHRSNDIDLISIHEYDNGCNVSHQSSIAVEASKNLNKPWYSGESGGSYSSGGDYTGGSGMGECLKREYKAYVDAPEGAGMLYWNFKMQPAGSKAFGSDTATFIGGSNVLWDAAKSFRHQFQGN